VSGVRVGRAHRSGCGQVRTKAQQQLPCRRPCGPPLPARRAAALPAHAQWQGPRGRQAAVRTSARACPLLHERRRRRTHLAHAHLTFCGFGSRQTHAHASASRYSMQLRFCTPPAHSLAQRTHPAARRHHACTPTAAPCTPTLFPR